MSKITWKAIPGLEGRYFICSDGRVLSTFGSGRIIRLRQLPRSSRTLPYRIIELTVDGKRWRRYLHHVMLEVFKGPRPEGFEASHKDGDVSNNRISNLIWETKLDNEKRKEKHNTRVRGSRHGRYKHGAYVHAQ